MTAHLLLASYRSEAGSEMLTLALMSPVTNYTWNPRKIGKVEPCVILTLWPDGSRYDGLIKPSPKAPLASAVERFYGDRA